MEEVKEFVVSARKYRPQTFDDVVGQMHITNTLRNAIKTQKIAHAFLFCGPRGVGKTTCARIMAKTLNCLHLSPSIEPCNKCDSCVAFNTSHSFNIHELDAASNNLVEDIRTLIEQVRIAPQVGKYNIFIIDEVHMLTTAAFNAFLKTLEEPPVHAIFILATTEKHKILPTILSRCQVFDFHRISIDDMANHLARISVKEGIDAEPDALHVIAQKADGSLRDALSIFDRIVTFAGNKVTYKDVIDNLNILDYDYYFKVTELAMAGDYKGLLLLFNEVLNNGFDGQHFLSGLGDHFRSLLVGQDEITLKLLEVGEQIRERYIQQAKSCNTDYLIEGLKIINDHDLNYRTANNKRLLVEIALLRLVGIKKKNSELTIADDKLISQHHSEPVSIPKTTSSLLKDSSDKSSNKTVHSNSTLVPRKTISIKNFHAQQKNEQSTFEPLELKETESFSTEKLEQAWNEYLERLIQQNKMSLYTMLKRNTPKIDENLVIKFELDHKAQESEFNEFKAEFLTFLRKTLNNGKIEIEAVVRQENTHRIPVTPSERLEELIKKNPSLKKLTDAFGLEIS